MKPLIGITVDCIREEKNVRTGGKLQLNWNYAEFVAQAGGVPVLIPPQADALTVAQILDGLIIPGGNDIDASNWGETNHPSVETISTERFTLEQGLYSAADPDLPVLGICYGCQFINVVRGGSLIQHLPDHEGASEHRDGVLQTYEVEHDSQLAGIIGSRISGESWHHQAIRNLGKGLRVVANNSDGVIEAIEAADRPWMIGVQWHPERTAQDSATRRLIEAFIGAATRYHDRRLAGATVS